MAKQIVRYLLEGDGTVPLFVEDGGYFLIGEERVGRSVDENLRHVPSTVVRMTKADLEARVSSIPFKDENGNELDGQGKLDILEAWLEYVGMSDLA